MRESFEKYVNWVISSEVPNRETFNDYPFRSKVASDWQLEIVGS